MLSIRIAKSQMWQVDIAQHGQRPRNADSGLVATKVQTALPSWRSRMFTWDESNLVKIQECKHFSRASGAEPASDRRRGHRRPGGPFQGSSPDLELQTPVSSISFWVLLHGSSVQSLQDPYSTTTHSPRRTASFGCKLMGPQVDTRRSDNVADLGQSGRVLSTVPRWLPSGSQELRLRCSRALTDGTSLCHALPVPDSQPAFR